MTYSLRSQVSPLESYSLQETNISREVKTICLAKSLELGITKEQLKTHSTFISHVLLLSKEKLFFSFFEQVVVSLPEYRID